MDSAGCRSTSRAPTFATVSLLTLWSFTLLLPSQANAWSLGSLNRRDALYGRQEEAVPTVSSIFRTESVASSTISTSSSKSSSSSSSFFSTSSTVGFVSVSSSSSVAIITPSVLPPPPSPSPSTSLSSVSLSSSATSAASLSSQSVSESSIDSSPTILATPLSATSLSLDVSTTLIVTNNLFTVSPASTPSVTGSRPVGNDNVPEQTSSVGTTGATSKGFWGNKGAVAGTFIVVSLIALGFVALLLINLAKRRNKAKHRRLRRVLFGEKNSDVGGGTTPGGSIHEPPLDPFARRDVVNDDLHFREATATAQYPFAGSGHAISSLQPDLATNAQTTPQPPLSVDSHVSHQSSTYWTPNPSQQSLHAQQPVAIGIAITTPTGTQYKLPSQAAQEAKEAANNPIRAVGENASYPVYNPAIPTPTTLDTNYTNSTYTHGTMNPSTTTIAQASSTAPQAVLNISGVRQSVDSFYGYSGERV